MDRKIPAVVFVIIEGVKDQEKGKIPLLQEKNRPAPRMWKLPGGAVEPGEWLEVAAYREVQEETGLLLERIGDSDKIYDEIKSGRSGKYNFVVYRAKYLRGTTFLGDEVEKLGFFSFQDVEEMIKKGEIVPTHVEPLKLWCFKKRFA